MTNSAIKLLHADNFFHSDSIDKLVAVANSLRFVEKEYGSEIENFNFVQPDLDPIFSRLLAEDVTVVEDHSGIFRRPVIHIHFESFETVNDWCFIIALESTTFNLYHHLSGVDNAIDNYKFNYQNLLEWDIYTNIHLKPNQGIIFRPWLFHSLSGGLIQVYRLTKKL